MTRKGALRTDLPQHMTVLHGRCVYGGTSTRNTHVVAVQAFDSVAAASHNLAAATLLRALNIPWPPAGYRAAEMGKHYSSSRLCCVHIEQTRQANADQKMFNEMGCGNGGC